MKKLVDLIAKSFYKIHHQIKNNMYTHYWFKGGRGSTKSSFISIQIILGMMKHPDRNAIALRKVGVNLKESVFSQLQWAIDSLGVGQYWQETYSPLALTYIPTGQKIIFRGADKPKKIKSIKLPKGYFGYVWFEEVDEFIGMDEIRMILQSLMRGGEKFDVFYSFNPPESINNWANQEVQINRSDRIVHHSTYLTVPPDWLGEQFFIEVDHLKKVNDQKYRHAYLGEATGTGREIFTNITARKITDAEIKEFDRIRRGLDFGYVTDPLSYGVMHYDKTRRRLYIFYEFYKVGVSNRAAAEEIKKENILNQAVTADSAEPKSIDEIRAFGINIIGAKKGPDSVRFGVKWLQDLEEIIIDPERCPNHYREFSSYEHDVDSNGQPKADYPDKNNHTIDEVRYACRDDMRIGGAFKL
jgi:PBSX family phage terminase large subunit